MSSPNPCGLVRQACRTVTPGTHLSCTQRQGCRSIVVTGTPWVDTCAYVYELQKPWADLEWFRTSIWCKASPIPPQCHGKLGQALPSIPKVFPMQPGELPLSFLDTTVDPGGLRMPVGVSTCWGLVKTTLVVHSILEPGALQKGKWHTPKCKVAHFQMEGAGLPNGVHKFGGLVACR